MNANILFLLIGAFFLSTFNNANAQVEVHKEPRHHPVFQDKQIRLLDVRVPPGDTTLYHIHQTPSLFIFFTTGEVGSQLLGKQPAVGKNIAGRIIFENLAAPNIRTHRVWNMDKNAFHVMDIEFLFKDSGIISQPLVAPQLSLEIDNTWVRAYKLILKQGSEFVLPKSEHAFMLVSFGVSKVQANLGAKSIKETLGPGNFIPIKKEETFSIKNMQSKNAEFALLEIR